MDFKLIKIALVLSLLSSCTSHKMSKFEYHLNKENTWINTYKTEVFWGCINESYKSDTLIKIITKKDFINQPEIIADWDIILKANETGQKVSKEIPKPIYPKFEEGDKEAFYSKNYFLASCLNYYASRELDSIAKLEYKIYLKNQKKMNN